MKIWKVRSIIDYFCISISSGYYYRLCITIVLFKRGFSFNFFEIKGKEINYNII